MKKSRKPKARQVETDVGTAIIRGLRELSDALERGEKLTDRFTVRTIRAPERPRQCRASRLSPSVLAREGFVDAHGLGPIPCSRERAANRSRD